MSWSGACLPLSSSVMSLGHIIKKVLTWQQVWTPLDPVESLFLYSLGKVLRISTDGLSLGHVPALEQITMAEV